MKESRLIIIVLLCFSAFLWLILHVLYLIYPNLIDYMSVGTNLYCGIIVGLVTSVC